MGCVCVDVLSIGSQIAKDTSLFVYIYIKNLGNGIAKNNFTQ